VVRAWAAPRGRIDLHHLGLRNDAGLVPKQTWGRQNEAMMRRSRLKPAVAILLFLLLSCQSSLGPKFGFVSGVVRYPDGVPVGRARVWIEGGNETSADDRGRYHIVAPADGITVTLRATDAYAGGPRAMQNHGSADVIVRENGAAKDIVLDHATPI